jgi:hypothetical protein
VVLSPGARFAAALVPLLALAASAAPSLAVAPPDSMHLVRLQAACDSAWRVRVTGSQAVYELTRPQVGERGIQLHHEDRPPALVTFGEPAPSGRWLAWSDIERIETQRSAAGRGALIGFTLGAVVGGLTVAASGPDLAEEGDNVVLFAATVFTLACGTVGLLLGLANGVNTPLYP